MHETTWQFWSLLGTFLAFAVTAGIFLGKLYQRVVGHDELIKRCDTSSIVHAGDLPESGVMARDEIDLSTLVCKSDCKENHRELLNQVKGMADTIAKDQKDLNVYMVKTANALGRIEGQVGRLEIEKNINSR